MCKVCKRHNSKLGKLPVREAEATPWHTLCIDLVGHYTIGKPKKDKDGKATEEAFTLHCLTMIDPPTGWFKIAEIDSRLVDYIANYLEFH